MTGSRFIGALAALLATGVAGAGVGIDTSSIAFRQKGSGAEITYRLTGGPAIVTMEVQTNTLANGAGEWVDVGGEHVQTVLGEVNRLVRGDADTTHKIVWRARKDMPDLKIGPSCIRAVLTAWATNAPPDWMVVGLDRANDVRFYATTNYLPGGFSSDLYKTDQLLMRRIPARGVVWRAGLLPVSTSEYNVYSKTTFPYIDQARLQMLTRDYYMGVYQVTQKQYRQLRPTHVTTFVGDKLPVSNVHYKHLRGYEAIDSSKNLDDNKIWPQAGHTVGSGCFIDDLRKLTGLAGFDLPTHAQWEYACRAGTDTLLNNGENTTDHANDVAWHEGNSEWDTTKGRRIYHEVGLKKPNAWLLYDMHGNVEECCLDRLSYGDDFLNSLAVGWQYGAVTVDPVGSTKCTEARCFIKAGGSCAERFKVMYSGSRPMGGWAYDDSFIGFRLMCSADFN